MKFSDPLDIRGASDRSGEYRFWLTVSGRRIFVGYHRALTGTGPRRVVVCCPPFAEEKNKSERLFVDIARRLAGQGFDVLRLDYGGTGDSAGTFEQATLATRREDIVSAIEYCRGKLAAEEVHLLGLRLGAALAADIAESLDGIGRLILLSPVVDLAGYLRLSLRSKLVKELLTNGKVSLHRDAMLQRLRHEAIDFDGFPISPELHAEMRTFKLLERIKNFRGPILIVCASLKPRVSSESEQLRERYEEAGADVTLAKVQCEPFWSVYGIPPFDKIVDVLADWIDGSDSSDLPPAAELPAMEHGGANRVETGYGVEHVVAIDVPGGFLTGVAHVPGNWRNGAGTAIVFVHGWAGYRIGPHRMLVNAARRLCDAGYLCIRIDVRGRGESSGNSADTSVSSILDDTQHAVNALRRHYRPGKIAVLGQCMGGSAALAVEDVDACISWSAPPADQTARAKTRKTCYMLGAYLAKMADQNTWRKILGRRLNLPMIREALFGHLRPPAAMREPAGIVADRRTRGARAPCLFVYGEKDPDAAGARTVYEQACRRCGRPTDFHVIPGANHSFYSIPWEREVLETTLSWMKEHVPPHGGNGS